jgi:membrane associated rhomboid family serine protease
MRKLAKYFQWLAIPNIAILIVTLQAAGFILVSSDPAWVGRLALIPSQVLLGEYWRLVTFLSLPLSLSPIWVIFVLWFLYFILNAIEQVWGALKTTLYVLTSVVITVAFSFAAHYPVIQISHFESSLFLAAAALFPNMEVRLFFAVPVKLKWLAWLSIAFVGLELWKGTWLDRAFILAIYSNAILFFGPALLDRARQVHRKRRFQSQMRR